MYAYFSDYPKIFRFILYLSFSLLLSLKTYPQPSRQQAIDKILGEIVEDSENEFDYSEISDKLTYYMDNPLNLNTASHEQLSELIFLSEIQILAILEYRRKYKGFATIYELRLIPELDDETINLLLFFTNVASKPPKKKSLNYYLPLDQNNISFKTERIVSVSNGEKQDTSFPGNPFKIYFRFYHQPDKNLSYGITMEKDAGEEFFKGSQPYGFDFYSAHFYYKPPRGLLKAVAIGDYFVSFGQGLVLSNIYYFGKSIYTDQVYVNKTGLSPYRSANEKNYFRGIAATFQTGKILFTPLISSKLLDGNLSLQDSSESNEDYYISSFDESGYHRTPNEISRKNTIGEHLAGLNLTLDLSNAKIGWTTVAGKYSMPVIKSDKLYKFYDFSGKNFYATGLNYSFVWKGFRFFGETGANGSGYAILSGIHSFLTSDLSLVIIYRNYSPDYFSPYSNALRENTKTANESGIFAGLNWRINKNWSSNFYYDQYSFPWLKYLVNGPSTGNEFYFTLNNQINYRAKQSLRIRCKSTEKNLVSEGKPLPDINRQLRYSFRYQIDFQPAVNMQLSTRIEYCLVEKTGVSLSAGFLTQQDISVAIPQHRIVLIFRYALFTINDYDARIYSYEYDLPGNFSSLMYYSRGIRFYGLCRYTAGDRINLYIKAGKTTFFTPLKLPETETHPEKFRSEIKMLVNFNF